MAVRITATCCNVRPYILGLRSKLLRVTLYTLVIIFTKAFTLKRFLREQLSSRVI